MREKGIVPEMRTIELVAEAWRAIGLLDEAMRLLNESEEDSDVVLNKIPEQSLETKSLKQTFSTSPNALQTPGVVVSDNGSSTANIRGQMISKKFEFS